MTKKEELEREILAILMACTATPSDANEARHEIMKVVGEYIGGLVAPNGNLRNELDDMRKRSQDSCNEHEDEYTLKTDDELIQMVIDFGYGEEEFHTAD